MSEEAPLIAAIEAGGTKFVCAVGTGPHDVRDVTRIPTTTPEDTMAGVTRFLSMAKSKYGSIAAIGIGSFGPIDLDRNSETYGYITSTPKPGWQFTNIVPKLKDRYHVPVAWDTDVNAAVLGEYLWGAGQDTAPLIYITVGTGVGGGVLINGQLLHGLLHPEIGHLLVPPPQNSSAFQQACHCPFHKSCVEGYICGPALASRWGVKAEALPPDHPAWEEVADVMAHALMNLTLSICPKRIILGGGVMSQEHILPLIRGQLHKLNNGYLRVPELGRNLDDFIVAPGLGARSGLLGALALGKYELDLHLKQTGGASAA